MKGKTPRHDREKISRRELKKDRAFREELAREWGVEKTPRSYRRVLEETYDRLPPEPIVRRRPLRSFARGMAALAAVCVLVCIGLLGLNAAYPQAMESLPGMGGAFQAINQKLGREVPQVTPSPTPPDTTSSEPPTSSQSDAAVGQVLAEDNGTKITEVKWYGNECMVTATVPYMGRFSEYLAMYGQSYAPLGIYPLATLEDGSSFQAEGIEVDGEDIYDVDRNQGQLTHILPDLSTDDVHVTWTFFFDRATEKAELTVYEDAFGLTNEDLGGRRTAEFTIYRDGTAKAAKNSVNAGLRKITPEECRETDRNVFENGWLAQNLTVVSMDQWEGLSEGPKDYNTYFKIVLFSEEPVKRVVKLNCYYGEGLVASVDNAGIPESSYASGRGTFLDEDIGLCDWFQSGDGYVFDMTTPVAATRDPYYRVVFALPVSLLNIEDQYENGQAVLGDPELRFRLVDGNTGEVLIDDVNVAVNHTSLNMEAWRKEIGKPGNYEDQAGSSPAPPIESDVSSVGEFSSP